MKGFVAIIQARMSSCRLPGKVLRRTQGRYLLDYMLERVRRTHCLEKIVVATSDQTSDDPVANFCAERGIEWVRGPLEDVAMRFLRVFEAFPAHAYVRLCADSPFCDPEIIERVAALYERVQPDLATNIYPRTFPKGVSVEVLSGEVLKSVYTKFYNPQHFEHVTRYFYEHPDDWEIVNYANPDGFDEMVDLSIDTLEQWQQFESVINRLGDAWRTTGWWQVADLMVEDGKQEVGEPC